MNNKTIARIYHISESHVERIIHDSFKQKCKEALSYHATLVLGIDGHSIHRCKFATTIKDLRNHRVYDCDCG